MLLRLPTVLTSDEVRHARTLLDNAPWDDGRVTAGTQSAQVKNNRQLPQDHTITRELQAMVLEGLKRHKLFFTAALPQHVFPPLFNRYAGEANAFGNHIDNAVRFIHGSGERLRTDVSCTLFLSDPAEYDGGELVIEDTYGTQAVKLPAGDMVIYPSSSVHRVEPVTRGARLASFFWVQSMVRSDEQRRLLFDLDMSILNLREAHGDTPAVVRLTGTYHNLLRMWADA
ncbi:Fe2+-dependent dioxygenase [Caldimonas brevitalea]|uniref:PKHD-type hydroxylase n=1 Tax=Caldimonas brevitalea TaxID=413882 RepID=A0A0G3BFR5_9BURK|nr:Fe2+-dependent dioxygenase [Caldimonas brevitalea]AKJ26773.1 PKHD-type hydroxylase [Caldimonas brevitalea]